MCELMMTVISNSQLIKIIHILNRTKTRFVQTSSVGHYKKLFIVEAFYSDQLMKSEYETHLGPI